jgi:aerobic-type carbon monoxide dehydrogenase small subunit (CoxS/CutS family)
MTNYKKRIQCKYCIDAIKGEVLMAYHIVRKHPEKIEEYIKGED